MPDRPVFDEELRRFTREMMGSSCAHMTDDELDAFMEPFRRIATKIVDDMPPAWWVLTMNTARVDLLRVLRARCKVELMAGIRAGTELEREAGS